MNKNDIVLINTNYTTLFMLKACNLNVIYLALFIYRE